MRGRLVPGFAMPVVLAALMWAQQNPPVMVLPVFLLWVYLSAVILLFGAEVSAAYARLRRHRPDEIPAAPSPRV